jgi:microsomal dipeptidase-like Zn-dependent dipeptidase
MAVAGWAIGRIQRWCDESDGQMVVIRTATDLESCRQPGGPVGVVICGQGGHMLDGRVENVAQLHELGLRLFAPAHVMDNDVVGSNTGRRKGRLSLFGREVVAELEAQRIAVDLAHMSVRGIEQTLPLLKRPFMLSHTGLTDVAGKASRYRRYSAATRNIPASLAGQIGAAGGTVGIVMSTQLLGGGHLSAAVSTIRLALESAGVDRVAIGSDMDGALKMVIDVEGYPALADALLRSDLPARTVEGVMGRNAIAALQTFLA